MPKFTKSFRLPFLLMSFFFSTILVALAQDYQDTGKNTGWTPVNSPLSPVQLVPSPSMVMITLDADDFPTGPLGQEALRGKYKNARLLDIQPAPASIADELNPIGNYNTQVTTKAFAWGDSGDIKVIEPFEDFHKTSIINIRLRTIVKEFGITIGDYAGYIVADFYKGDELIGSVTFDLDDNPGPHYFSSTIRFDRIKLYAPDEYKNWVINEFYLPDSPCRCSIMK